MRAVDAARTTQDMAPPGEAVPAQAWNWFIKRTQRRGLTEIGARHQLTKAMRILLDVVAPDDFSDLRY